MFVFRNGDQNVKSNRESQANRTESDKKKGREKKQKPKRKRGTYAFGRNGDYKLYSTVQTDGEGNQR